MESLRERQFLKEADGVEVAAREYEKLAAHPPRSLVARQVLALIFDPLVQAIRTEQTALQSPGGSKLPPYAPLLLSLDPVKLALLTVRTLIDLLQQPRDEDKDEDKLLKLTDLASKLGHACWRERRLDLLRERALDVAQLLSRRHSNPAMGRKRSQVLAERVAEPWSIDHRDVRLGVALLELAAQSGVVELSLRRERIGDAYRSTTVVALSERARLGLVGQGRRFATRLLPPSTALPMLVSPTPWQSVHGGGYLANSVLKDRLLIKRGHYRQLEELGRADLRHVLSAVNTLQNTPWQINQRLLETLLLCLKNGEHLSRLGLPPRSLIPNKQTSREDQKISTEQWSHRLRIEKRNRQILADRALLRARIEQCEMFKGEHFYFTYQLDTRGRCYPVPQVLNPQGSDLGRSLLEFAEGRPLGETGEYWLAIHVANGYHSAKLSFEASLGWIRENDKGILTAARRPLDHLNFWGVAKKPWSFLAACFEWQSYREYGSEFQSHIPVAVDGTCSGLQHLSAMARDLEGGRATNLIPSEEPADLYDLIAREVSIAIDRAKNAGQPYAQIWAGNINRGVVKQATMTTPYGVTRYGIKKQLRELKVVREILKGSPEPNHAIKLLAILLSDAIESKVSAAPEVMSWLQEVAKLLAGEGSGITWSVPSGFVVVQEHREPRSVEINIGDRRLYLIVDDASAEIDAKAQRRCIAPNFVHSYDAAHLALVLSRLHAEGVNSVATIHDAFAVHACNVDLLGKVLREEFVAIYREPVLMKFFEEQQMRNPGVSLPEPSFIGKRLRDEGFLDLETVLQSKYFFC